MYKLIVNAILLANCAISSPWAVAAPGDLDPTFGNAGTISLSCSTLVATLQAPDGGIILVSKPATGAVAVAVTKYDADGQNLDISFGVNGTQTVPRPTPYTSIGLMDATLQNDGKIVAIGGAHNGTQPSDIFITRLNADGSLDTSFGTNGIRVFSYSADSSYNRRDQPTSVAATADGKILIGATTDTGTSTSINWASTVMRLNSNGSVDTTFKGAGRRAFYSGNHTDMALAPDGSIYGIGTYSSTISIAKLLPTGADDVSFGTNGRTTTNLGLSSTRAYAAAVQSDNKLLISGLRDGKGFIARFNTSGSNPIDLGYGGGLGYQSYDSPLPEDSLTALAVTPTASVVAAGYMSNLANLASRDVLTLRTDSNGTLDTSFGINGFATYDVSGSSDYVTQISLQQDGKILVSAKTTTSGLVQCTALRYLP